VRAPATTLTEWPAPVPMKRCESDAMAQLLRELDRLESCIDGLAELDDDWIPPTDRGTNSWGAE
jgi:hypothetical protein